MMKRSTLSKCAAFLSVLCLLLSTAVAAGTEGTPPSDEPVVVTDAPSDEPVVVTDTPSDEPTAEPTSPSDEPSAETDLPSDEPEGDDVPPQEPEEAVDPDPPRESRTVTNSAAGTESHTWVQEPDGTWRYVSSDAFRVGWGYSSDPYAGYDAAKGNMGSNHSEMAFLVEDARTDRRYYYGTWYNLSPEGSLIGTVGDVSPVTPGRYKIDANGSWVNG